MKGETATKGVINLLNSNSGHIKNDKGNSLLIGKSKHGLVHQRKQLSQFQRFSVKNKHHAVFTYVVILINFSLLLPSLV